jgi:uncharacterized paraquat-inducible protein A
LQYYSASDFDYKEEGIIYTTRYYKCPNCGQVSIARLRHNAKKIILIFILIILMSLSILYLFKQLQIRIGFNTWAKYDIISIEIFTLILIILILIILMILILIIANRAIYLIRREEIDLRYRKFKDFLAIFIPYLAVLGIDFYYRSQLNNISFSSLWTQFLIFRFIIIRRKSKIQDYTFIFRKPEEWQRGRNFDIDKKDNNKKNNN